MNRIKMENSIMDVFTILSEGKPGALTVLLEIDRQSRAIDPDCLDPLLTLLLFDSFGIYGSPIWVLYKDVCGSNVARTIAVVRAAQMGLLPGRALVAACQDNPDRPTLKVETLVAALRVRLPRFDPQNICGITLDRESPCSSAT